MAKIATVTDSTVWQCDSGCGTLVESTSAFALPAGWWTVEIRRRTEIDESGRGGKPKAGSVDACCKDCLLDVVRYQNQHYVDYLDPDLR